MTPQEPQQGLGNQAISLLQVRLPGSSAQRRQRWVISPRPQAQGCSNSPETQDQPLKEASGDVWQGGCLPSRSPLSSAPASKAGGAGHVWCPQKTKGLILPLTLVCTLEQILHIFYSLGACHEIAKAWDPSTGILFTVLGHAASERQSLRHPKLSSSLQRVSATLRWVGPSGSPTFTRAGAAGVRHLTPVTTAPGSPSARCLCGENPLAALTRKPPPSKGVSGEHDGCMAGVPPKPLEHAACCRLEPYIGCGDTVSCMPPCVLKLIKLDET